ncbi:MAG: hypothetical protein RBT16_09145 [Desulfococcus multivorans]|jgi:putative flippase GtrA|nr:hypothetical protein [Desulfococcus multivorans]
MDSATIESDIDTRKQAFLYLQASIVGTLGNFFSRFVFAEIMTFGWSVIIANYVGMVIVFFISYRYAFGVKRFQYGMAARFALVAHVGLAVVWGSALLVHEVIEILAQWAGFSSLYAFVNTIVSAHWVDWGVRLIDSTCHGLGILSGFFVNFFGHKFFSFKDTWLTCN